jgi:hypothetical protein
MLLWPGPAHASMARPNRGTGLLKSLQERRQGEYSAHWEKEGARTARASWMTRCTSVQHVLVTTCDIYIYIYIYIYNDDNK